MYDHHWTVFYDVEWIQWLSQFSSIIALTTLYNSIILSRTPGLYFHENKEDLSEQPC